MATSQTPREATQATRAVSLEPATQPPEPHPWVAARTSHPHRASPNGDLHLGTYPPASPAVTAMHAILVGQEINEILTAGTLPCVVEGLRQGCTSSPSWAVTYLCTLPLPEPSYSQAYERGLAFGIGRAGVG